MEVKEILALLAEQEQERLHQHELQKKRESDAEARSKELAKLQHGLTVHLQNRAYSKALMVEQLQRDISSHGEVVQKLLEDTYEAIFLHLNPRADDKINRLKETILTYHPHASVGE
ncbi:hypothetical protein [Kluyvera genomosp. 2]|uniref:hypothetical protein n=1 Tax=Kluyvera genomosp. 2 TaxID=2774054 RepID=UPI002FD85FC1